MPPPTNGILETALYVDDVPRAARFYEAIFGFPVIAEFLPRGCALAAGPKQVLLLFRKRGSLDGDTPHDGEGELHFAFAIAVSELTAWEAWLGENGIGIEEKHVWPEGGISLYFRDPDRHLVEVTTPGVWTIY